MLKSSTYLIPQAMGHTTKELVVGAIYIVVDKTMQHYVRDYLWYLRDSLYWWLFLRFRQWQLNHCNKMGIVAIFNTLL